MATLYLVTKSPFVHSDSKEAVNLAVLQKEIEDKVGIVFLQDAVLGVRKNQTSDNDETFEHLLLNAIEQEVELYALEGDLMARAIAPENIVEGVKVIDYSRLVDLIMDEYVKIVSWT